MTKKHLFLVWAICFTAIPLLSFFGRSLQGVVFSLLSPFQLAILLLIVSVIIFLLFVCRRPPGRNSTQILLEILWLGGGFVILNMVLPPVERVHVLLFSVFGFLSQRLFGTRVALIICLTVSGLDELLQYFLPDRVGDLRDVLTNALSSTLGIRLSCLFTEDSYDSSRSHSL